MTDMSAPTVTIKPIPVISDEHVSALLKAAAGRDFPAVPDTAVPRLLLDTGIRRGLVGLDLADVDLKDRTGTVLVNADVLAPSGSDSRRPRPSTGTSGPGYCTATRPARRACGP